jgi:hypothetical protein
MSDGVVDTLHKVVLNCRSFVCTVNLICDISSVLSIILRLSFMICSPNTNVTFVGMCQRYASRVLLDLIPDLNTTLPCYMSHQNVEGAIYCGECNPNGHDFD